MKICFLDIDGVLNNAQFFLDFHKSGKKFHPDDMIDPANVMQLNKIITATGAAIVVSSSWRIGKSVLDLQALLSKHGVQGDVIDKTPDLCCSDGLLWVAKTRGGEIQFWLDDKDDIDSFVILDDDDNMGENLLNNFVQTSMDTGLTDVHVQLAIGILNKGV